jgi:predicted AlkP superfamily phosphohydrolase/phosphomutase
MGKLLTDALNIRTEIAKWLLKERLPDWDLALVVATEIHSATEGLWFGVDEDHPLYNLQSAMVANDGLKSTYKAADRLVGNLVDSFPDAQIIIFSLGGMGPNQADIPGMVLLPELLYRKKFNKPLFEARKVWEYAINGIATLSSNESWAKEIKKQYAIQKQHPDHSDNYLQQIKNYIFNKLTKHGKQKSERDSKYHSLSLNWMPAMYYSSYWKDMDVFALPSFNTGRIRINLKGRERSGKIPLKRYYQFVENLKKYLLKCQSSDGGSIIKHIDTTVCKNPLELDPSDADLIIEWDGINQVIHHPETGTIGPVPYRRTGGHFEKSGITYIYNTNLSNGYHGLRSAYDIIPTIITLMGESIPPGLSGISLF